jgi:hypothetical protein
LYGNRQLPQIFSPEELRPLEKKLGADNCVVRRLDAADKSDYRK